MPPHRVRDTLADLSAGLGGARTIVIARELTKMFESVHTGILGDAVEWVSADENRQKGEFVLIVRTDPWRLASVPPWGAGAPTVTVSLASARMLVAYVVAAVLSRLTVLPPCLLE